MGSGYTVEGQKTQEEKYGGLQIEVIPSLHQNLRCLVSDTDEHVTYDAYGSATVKWIKRFNERRTPAEENLQPGDFVRSYPININFSEPFKARDICQGKSSTILSVSY